MRFEVNLRNITEDDLLTFFHHQIDPDANKMAAFPPRSLDEFMNHWKINVLGNASSQNKAIVVNRKLAGYVTSWKQDEKRLLAYWIGKEHWGRGIATQSLFDFLSLLRERPVYALVAKHNIGSIRVLEKCGFNRVDQVSSESLSESQRVEESFMELP